MLGVHRIEELSIILSALEFIAKELHRIVGSHWHQDTAQHPHLRKSAFVDQQLLTACPGPGDVECREGSLVGQFAV